MYSIRSTTTHTAITIESPPRRLYNKQVSQWHRLRDSFFLLLSYIGKTSGIGPPVTSLDRIIRRLRDTEKQCSVWAIKSGVASHSSEMAQQINIWNTSVTKAFTSQIRQCCSNIRQLYPASELQGLRELVVLECDLSHRQTVDGLNLIKNTYDKCLVTLNTVHLSKPPHEHDATIDRLRQVLDTEMDKIIVLYKTLAFRQTAILHY